MSLIALTFLYPLAAGMVLDALTTNWRSFMSVTVTLLLSLCSMPSADAIKAKMRELEKANPGAIARAEGRS